jgi:Tol biopolymer transport system component/DNA-binding winged helix-turn-helix (wHTH) protein
MPSEIRFGDYALDTLRHTLHCGDREIKLGERTFGVLQLLVENAGRVVGRQELIDAIWHDVAVTDDSLARAVSDLRTALGDDASQPRYIRTVHRQGYLFVAPLGSVDGPEPVTVVEGRRWWREVRRRLLLLATLAALVVASVLVVWGLKEIPVGAASNQPNLGSWKLRALGPRPFTAKAIKPAFAKTSNLLALVAPDADTGVHSLFLLRPDGGEPLQLTRGIEVRGPAPEFTANDSHIIFTTYHSDPELGMVPDLWLAPLPAGEPTLFMEKASAASSSPDGRALVYAGVTESRTSIRVRHQDGRDLEVAPRGFWPRWSPDGRWIAYTTSNPEGGDGTMHIVRPDGSENRQLTTTASQTYGLTWMPDSSRVIFSTQQDGSTTLWSVDIENGDRQTVTRGPGTCTCPAVAHDGRRLVFDFSYHQWYVYLVSEPGGAASQILVEPGIWDVALSPEGSRIAVVLCAEAQSPAVIVLDLGTMERRTVSGLAAFAVAWMPGGRDLLVAAPAPDGISQWIWRLPIGGGLPDPIMKGVEHWDAPSPSPDGSMIAAVRRVPDGCELAMHHLESGERRTLAEKVAIAAPRWSPDAQHLVWSGPQRPGYVGGGGVWVCPAEGGSPRQLTVDGAWPVWEKDGAHLLFLRFLEHEGIWRVPLAGGSPQLVQRLDGDIEDLNPEGLDGAQAGFPLLLRMEKFTGQVYALEPPAV